MKRAVLILILTLTCTSLACQKRAEGPAVRIDAAPGFRLTDYPVVGFLGLGKAVAAVDAIDVMTPIVEEALQTTPPPEGVLVLPGVEVARRSRSQGTFDVYADVRDYWQDAKKVDKFKLESLCTAIGVDALLLGSVEDWTRNQVSWGAEGTSFTRVTVSLNLYRKTSARPIWTGRCTKMMESIEHEPSEIMAGPIEPGAERMARRTGGVDPGAERAQRAAPEPPPCEEVGRVVAAALTASLFGH